MQKNLTTLGNVIVYAIMVIGLVSAMALKAQFGFEGALWGGVFGAVGGGIGGGLGYAIAAAAGQVKSEETWP